jgi:cell wall-associated NlpC family hydrolase
VGVRFIGRGDQQDHSVGTSRKASQSHHRPIGRVAALGASLAVAIPSKLIATPSSPAAAYNGQTAANYANVYAVTPNPNYPFFTGTGVGDCANFVSQALKAGGQPVRYITGTHTKLGNWWDFSYTQTITIYEYYWQSTYSATAADDLKMFLTSDSDWGTAEATYSYAADGATPPYDAIGTGDVLFYNWGQGMGISHAAIQVGTSGLGSYVDEHTSNRKQVFWTLKPYNPFWATTTVYEVHITE